MTDSRPRREFHCSQCGEHHEIALAFGPAAPLGYFLVPEQERELRCELTPDTCLVDEQFYLVGNLELPILDRDEIFSWDVWVSLSHENMQRVHQLWESKSRIDEPPYFGWLSSSLPGYPETVGLKTNVHTRAVGRRPFIELEPTDHPLALEQRNGIDWERVKEIARMIAHQGS